MWNSLKKSKSLRRLFLKRDEEDPKLGEERFEPVGTVLPAQEPMQDVREFVPAPVVGLYDDQAKNKCRSDVISHAIRCLTTERQTSACVQRGHVRRVWNTCSQHFTFCNTSRLYFILFFEDEVKCFFAVTPTNVITNDTITKMISHNRKKTSLVSNSLTRQSYHKFCYRKFCVNCEYNFADIILFLTIKIAIKHFLKAF